MRSWECPQWPEVTNTGVGNRARLLAGVFVLPLLVLSLYLVGSRVPTRWFSQWSDFTAFGVARLSGAAPAPSIGVRTAHLGRWNA